MSDTRKNLPDEERESGESLDFTQDELIDEVSKFLRPAMLPGDVTVKMMVERYRDQGMTDAVARKTMERMAQTGNYQLVVVRGDRNLNTLVLRRKVK